MLGVAVAVMGLQAAMLAAEQAAEARRAAPQPDVIDIPPEDVRVVDEVKLIEGPAAALDWQMGLPPFGLPVEATIRGHVRRGQSDGAWFRFSDCTHPMQNSVVDVHEVEAWRLPGEVSCA